MRESLLAPTLGGVRKPAGGCAKRAVPFRRRPRPPGGVAVHGASGVRRDAANRRLGFCVTEAAGHAPPVRCKPRAARGQIRRAEVILGSEVSSALTGYRPPAGRQGGIQGRAQAPRTPRNRRPEPARGGISVLRFVGSARDDLSRPSCRAIAALQ